ncbi:MAG: hypothetical protein ACT4NU_07080 [Chromatiales bacterium]
MAPTVSVNGPHRQQGVVLILIVLILVVASSSLLLTQLNAAASEGYRRERSAAALEAAREALIGYAASYPDNPATTDFLAGPGFLPCPDTDNDGSPNPPCGTLAETVRVGRLPWEFLGLHDVRDSSGERLWYALSGNFRNNPKTFPLNSETPGQLTIDGSGDIVAVLLAPGPSFNDQLRPSNVVSHYLEGENSDPDPDFVTSGAGDFNDQVLVISRRDFMGEMEKRVLGEAANSVSQYREVAENLTPSTPDDGRYPWSSPFAAPRAATMAAPMIAGTAAASSITQLQDPTKDFVTLGVRVDDIVQNVTDGSKGVITAVAATTLTVAALRDGAENDFDAGDAYQIPRNNGDILSGTARDGHLPYHAMVQLPPPAGVAGEAFRTGFTLDWDIREANGAVVTAAFLPALPPPVVTAVANYVPGLRATIQKTLPRPLLDSVAVPPTRDPVPVLSANGICLWSMDYPANFPTAGQCPLAQTATDSVDCSGTAAEPYFTRTATAGSAGTTLMDAEADFNALGVNPGDVVENQTSVISGFVTAVTSPTTLTVSGLTFAANDGYRLRIATRELPLPPPGTATLGSLGPLLEDTNVDFLALGVNAGDYVENLSTGLKGVIQTVGLPTPSHLIVDLLSGVTFVAGQQYQLTNAATAGSAGLTLMDSSQDFVALSVRAGDVVRNLDDGSIGRVATVGTNQITVIALTGGASNSFNAGDEYLIRSGLIETRQYAFRPMHNGTVSFANSAGTKVRDVVIGSPAAFAPLPEQPPPAMPAIPPVTITDVDVAGTQLGNATLSIPAGTSGFVSTGNIHMDFAPLDGAVTAVGATGLELIDSTRDFVQLGVRPGDWVEKLGVGCSKGRVESVGPASQVTVKNVPGGSITFAANDRYRIYHELPPWFVRNNWHQLIYAAASPQEVPTSGSTGSCTIGTDCLVLRDGADLATNNDRIRALLIAAGPPVGTQDRTTGVSGAYFEGQNDLPVIGPPFSPPAPCPGAPCEYERGTFPPVTNTFNDEVRIVARQP